MKTIAGLLLATLLTMTAGCARTDWIDRTLVTVDVTGTWSGSMGGGPGAYPVPDLLLELEQQGSTVTGSVRFTPGGHAELNGTVAGDVSRFKGLRAHGNASGIEGELTVSGDEMSGQISTPVLGGRPLSLRRVDPSRPASPPR